MAKPNHTRITHVPANPGSSTANTDNTGNTTADPSASAPLPPLVASFLEALRSRQAQVAPVLPKSARRPRIKPRRRVTVSASLSPETIVEIPTIRMCGHWLAHAGFGVDKRVQVHVTPGVLVLVVEGGDNQIDKLRPVG